MNLDINQLSTNRFILYIKYRFTTIFSIFEYFELTLFSISLIISSLEKEIQLKKYSTTCYLQIEKSINKKANLWVFQFLMHYDLFLSLHCIRKCL